MKVLSWFKSRIEIPIWVFGLFSLFIIFLICLVFTSPYNFLFGNPTPLSDRGHRVFGVADEKAQIAVLRVLAEAGLKERFTFDVGTTHQTLLSDNLTVIMHEDNPRLPSTGPSIVVRDPLEAANRTVVLLQQAGYSAQIHQIAPEFGNKIVLVTSNAFFGGWGIVYRLSALELGQPPMRYLTR